VAAGAAGALCAQTPSLTADVATTVAMPLAVEIGAPSADSLVHLVLARFASGSAEAFDSVYPDPLGRAVVGGAAQRKQLRTPGLGRVLWSDDQRAVLL